jgi:hypothetical protein
MERRRYDLDSREEEARFVRHEYACDVCAGAYRVAGIVRPGKPNTARNLRSYPLPLADLEGRGGWPCGCADVCAGVRITP